MKSEITISEMEFEDLIDVFRLGNKLFTPDKWPNLYRTWDEYEILERFISDGEFCIVAHDKNKLIGFAIGAIVEKPRNPWIYGYLVWTGVDEKYKGMGIGKRLLKQITKLFSKAGAKIILVDTSIENENALNFFKKNGFKNEEGHIFLSKNISKNRKGKTKSRNKKPNKYLIGKSKKLIS